MGSKRKRSAERRRQADKQYQAVVDDISNATQARRKLHLDALLKSVEPDPVATFAKANRGRLAGLPEIDV